MDVNIAYGVNIEKKIRSPQTCQDKHIEKPCIIYTLSEYRIKISRFKGP